MRLALAALLLALTAQSAADAIEIPTGVELDTERSRARFSVTMRWLQTLTGRFERFEGEVTLQLDGDRRVTVEVDAASLDFGGTGRVTAWAKSDEFFDVANHPTIRFRSQPFDAALVREGGTMRGELTLRGVAREIGFEVLPADCDDPGFDCPIRLSGQVSRSAFGMDARPISVLDRVRLAFDVYLRREE